eukprot:6931620-Karenia_brevis.AAC.1
MLRSHSCPAKEHIRKRMELFPGGWMPVRQGPPLPQPQGWLIATDGSGQEVVRDGVKHKVAGWGVVIFRWPIESDLPDCVLHAP